jgi:hypothetical protein
VEMKRECLIWRAKFIVGAWAFGSWVLISHLYRALGKLEAGNMELQTHSCWAKRCLSCCIYFFFCFL